MKQYCYCVDTNKYVVYAYGFYSLEKGGVLKPNRYYDPILIGGVVGIWDIKKRILQTAW